MSEKRGIWAFILNIIVQILNFILKKMGHGNQESPNVEYKKDEQENPDMKEKIEQIIKDKINAKKGDGK